MEIWSLKKENFVSGLMLFCGINFLPGLSSISLSVFAAMVEAYLHRDGRRSWSDGRSGSLFQTETVVKTLHDLTLVLFHRDIFVSEWNILTITDWSALQFLSVLPGATEVLFNNPTSTRWMAEKFSLMNPNKLTLPLKGTFHPEVWINIFCPLNFYFYPFRVLGGISALHMSDNVTRWHFTQSAQSPPKMTFWRNSSSVSLLQTLWLEGNANGAKWREWNLQRLQQFGLDVSDISFLTSDIVALWWTSGH